MAHRTSAAALHAARVILKNFDLEVIPPEQLPSGKIWNLQANETCLAIVIDLMTNIFEVASLRPELRYWQTRLFADTADAPQLMNFFQKCLEAFEKLPQEDEMSAVMTLETPAEFGGKPIKQQITKASREATRGIFHYYRVTPRKPGIWDAKTLALQVSKAVEVSLGVLRIAPAKELLNYWKIQLRQGKATKSDIKLCLRKVGIILECLPNYENREEEVKLL